MVIVLYAMNKGEDSLTNKTVTKNKSEILLDAVFYVCVEGGGCLFLYYFCFCVGHTDL